MIVRLGVAIALLTAGAGVALAQAQTVASLLRIQARRSHSDEARDALTQAMRRVSAIAVVHDTLSEGLAQNVDFDDVFARVLKLVAEVAAAPNTPNVDRPPMSRPWRMTRARRWMANGRLTAHLPERRPVGRA